MSDPEKNDREQKDPSLDPAPPDATAGEAPPEALSPMSRRRFLGGAALGAATLAIGLKDPVSAFAAPQENADVTVDGILVTLLSAPLGSLGSSTWTVTQTFASTFTLQTAANLSQSLTASVTDSFNNPIGSGTFSVGGTSSFTQSNSVQVAAAITIRSTTSFAVTTQSPGTVANTLFLGISSPKLNFHGKPANLLWKFVNNSTGGLLALSVGELQSGVWDGVIRPSTRDAWLAQYPLIADPTGSTLVKPRFKRRYTVDVSAGASVNFSVETSDGTAYSTSKTASFTAEITATGTFMDATVKTSFQVGNKLTITMTSVQEVSSTQIIKFATVLQRSAPGTFIIYRDRVFKTWIVIDGGPPAMSGQPVVQGLVNGNTGTTVAGALVTLTQGTQDFVTATDGAGNYVIATPAGSPLSTGSYSVVSGNVSQTATVGSGTSYANFYNVNPGTARTPRYIDSGSLE